MLKLFPPIAVMLTVALTGCLGEESDPGYITSWASVDSVHVISARVPVVTIDVLGMKPTPCHEAANPTTAEDLGAHKVIIYMSSRIPRDRVCIQVLASYKKRIEVPVREPGEWAFVFRGHPGGKEFIKSVTVTR